MTVMMSTLSLILSTFMIMTHPLLLVMLLVFFTLLVINILLLLFNSSWVSMILFLVFLGGLLVIFAYLSALVPNEVEKKHFFWAAIVLSPFMSIFFMTTKWNSNLSMTIINYNFMQEMSFVMFLLLYLMMTLISMMILTQALKMPLHQVSY